MKQIISLILSFFLLLPSYLFSFLPKNIDSVFGFESGAADGRIMVSDNSFGIGIYVPNEASFLAWVYEREKTSNTDPSKDGSTSYIAAVEWLDFASFMPIEYNYSIATGTVAEMRNAFSTVK